jgi:hypothetical protein
MTTPSTAPPEYHSDASPTAKTYGATPDASSSAPLLGGAAASTSARNAWMDQPDDGDLPDDFKVGVNVVDCDVEIRMGFVRKVCGSKSVRSSFLRYVVYPVIPPYLGVQHPLRSAPHDNHPLHRPSTPIGNRVHPRQHMDRIPSHVCIIRHPLRDMVETT